MNVLSTFLNVYELHKSKLAEHSHLLSGYINSNLFLREFSFVYNLFKVLRLPFTLYYPEVFKAVYFVLL